MKSKAADAGAGSCATAAAALEDHLREGILVQAGLDCPAKPLLQAPVLRPCQGMAAPLGIRYSGMSVVYGAATGHVLAVMDTANALRMAPAAAMRSSAGGMLPSAGSFGGLPGGEKGASAGGAESPAGVSAGISAATSAAPSPPFSRASSCGAALADAAVGVSAQEPTAADMVPAMLQPQMTAAAAPAPQPLLSLSGRSITAAPIIQVVAAPASTSTNAASPQSASVPTTAPAQVLASFGILGVKTTSGRDGAVRCCRIMPASALSAASGAAEPAAGVGKPSGLGLAVQVEVSCATAGTLRVFLEGPEVSGHDHDGENGQHGPVRHVAVDGKPARWSHDTHSCILAVLLPPAASATAQRSVQIYL
ncbi:hypothetical protein GPECTOR_2g1372 [Gonium pectorale]|uniref:Uncharacterized protein n=1 Tax=Gonium pectorale TaxID=33097 RepID=A0A150H153_GONPE|nr:hypothetical protein GPECTOR_2g1372 [Gonium pectorale]|eukprot:KXZ55821.1 hypothetical protein GPECTOR_2g1372 [Gonium pectorale]